MHDFSCIFRGVSQKFCGNLLLPNAELPYAFSELKETLEHYT